MYTINGKVFSLDKNFRLGCNNIAWASYSLRENLYLTCQCELKATMIMLIRNLDGCGNGQNPVSDSIGTSIS